MFQSLVVNHQAQGITQIETDHREIVPQPSLANTQAQTYAQDTEKVAQIFTRCFLACRDVVDDIVA